jgi:TRAP-type C4-dicarboxylate transport system substrate-binding protein
MDGELGTFLARKIEEKCNYRILGWFENGFRQISNKLRPIRTPADMKDMSVRVLPSDVQKRTFELLGADARRLDLTEAIAMVKAGTIDAQENPLANTVTYHVHKFHRYHTISNHFYVSRPIFFHRDAFDSWPADLQAAMREAVRDAVLWQRDQAVIEDQEARAAAEKEGCEIIELTSDQHAAFAKAVQPLLDESRGIYGAEMFRMVGK